MTLCVLLLTSSALCAGPGHHEILWDYSTRFASTLVELLKFAVQGAGEEMVNLTTDYTGSDLANLCKHALQAPLREWAGLLHSR